MVDHRFVEDNSDLPDIRQELVSLREDLANSEMKGELLEESLQNLDLYLDNRGWTSLWGAAETEGPDLDQLHESSKRIRQMRAMNVHVKRGLSLRSGYIWDGGIHYDESKIPGARQGRGVNVQERIRNPINQANFFSSQARQEREAALYCDSQVFYVGDEADYTLRAIPIAEITAVYTNPDFPSEVWAYKREWNNHRFPAQPEPRKEWIFLNSFWSKRVETINNNGEDEPVSRTKRMFGKPVNTNIGWILGVPDALGGMAWAEQYRQFLVSGKKVSDAMAKIWATAKVNTPTGGSNAAAKIGSSTDGNTAIIGMNNSLTPLATAGQSYDFAKGLPLLASFAAGIDVSVISLSADPGSAGASYGSAKALDLPEQLTTAARREYHRELDKEVLVWLGADKDIDVWFNPLTDNSEIYRLVQAALLKWGSGLYSPDEIKGELEGIIGQSSFKDAPDGVLIPNNQYSEPRSDIDPGGNAYSGPDSNASASNGGSFAPTQGSGARTNPSGSGDQNASDLRTDQIS